MKARINSVVVAAVVCVAGGVSSAQVVILSGTQTTSGTATAYQNTLPPVTNTFSASAPVSTQSWDSGLVGASAAQINPSYNSHAGNRFISTINPASEISYSCQMTHIANGGVSLGASFSTVSSTFEIRFSVQSPTTVIVTGSSTRNSYWQQGSPCLMTLAREGQTPIVSIDNPQGASGFPATVTHAATTHTLTPGTYVLRADGSQGHNNAESGVMNMSISMDIIDCNGPLNEYAYALRDEESLEARWQHAMAFDSTSNSFIAFGGRNDAGVYSSATKRWNGTDWTTLAPTTPPAPRIDHAMCAAPNGGILMHGGKTSPTIINPRTWRFRNNQWTQLTVTTQPTARGGHAMSFDPVRNRAVMFGGFTSTVTSGETWEFYNEDWHLASSTGPSPRFATAMAYDPIRNNTVLFGGIDSNGLQGDTWTWNGTTWTQVQTPGPAPRNYHTLQWDQTRGTIMLVGGRTPNAPDGTDEVWDFNGSTWTLRTTPFYGGPVWAHAVASKPSEPFDTILSGGTTNGAIRSDTWIGSDDPFVLEQPQDQIRRLGSTATFSVSVVGADLDYQWLFNGQEMSDTARISGSATPTLTISNIQASDEGAYSCAITSCSGNTASDVATLDIRDCDSIDFNNDTSVFDPQDIDAFLSVYSEGPCIPANATCNDIDFNYDGSVFDPCDIDSFLTRFSEGPCTPCGE